MIVAKRSLYLKMDPGLGMGPGMGIGLGLGLGMGMGLGKKGKTPITVPEETDLNMRCKIKAEVLAWVIKKKIFYYGL